MKYMRNNQYTNSTKSLSTGRMNELFAIWLKDSRMEMLSTALYRIEFFKASTILYKLHRGFTNFSKTIPATRENEKSNLKSFVPDLALELNHKVRQKRFFVWFFEAAGKHYF